MNKIVGVFLIFILSVFAAYGQEKKYIKYQVQEGETIISISKKLLITPSDLLKLNPDIENGLAGVKILIVPNKNYKPTSPEEHKDYVEDGFLYHKVLPKETFSKLKRAYGTRKKVLIRFNPVLKREDLKAGQIIKIPVPDSFKLNGEDDGVVSGDTKPYLVKPKETKYSIARRYGITIERLEELNPILKEEGLKSDAIIQVPNTPEIPNESEEYVNHQVEAGDTYFNLGQRFAVSQEDLIAANPDLQEGLKVGMLIKIPTLGATEKVFTPFITSGKEIKALLLLPFMSNKSSVNFEKSRTSDIVSDFYLGAALALDSLKQQGLSVHVKVFDTQNSKDKIKSVFSAVDLDNVDVIIGPMFYSNLEYVAGFLGDRQIPLISPVSRNNHADLDAKSVIQEVASAEGMSNKVLSYLEANYKDQNLVIISDTAKVSQPILTSALERLQKLDSSRVITVIKPEEGYIKRELFIEKLPEDQDNWVLLISDDAVVTRDVVNNLGSLPETVKTTFFALNRGKNFDDQKDINNHLAHVNFHYPTHSFIDYQSDEVKRFVSRYQRINYAVPSEYSFKGFDLMYDALLRFASYEGIDTALNSGFSERMSTKFEYHSNGFNKGFVNNGVFLVKYDGLNLVKVE
ncbi:MAG: LysM peptidoglycan-binding domain-containing protein [Flavobacteriaceae bacterium]|nr:LysM peptidoglycan-binding domain-containing protein [Flavobacteriaceae bacterium]